jgi:hypothetical protein
MKPGRKNDGAAAGSVARPESFGICGPACQLFKDFGNGPETPVVPRNLIAPLPPAN